MKPFDGQPDSWCEFFDSFKCTVHDNLSLNDIQKMTYLKNVGPEG